MEAKRCGELSARYVLETWVCWARRHEHGSGRQVSNDEDLVVGGFSSAEHVRLVIRPGMKGQHTFLQDYLDIDTVKHKGLPAMIKDETWPRTGMDEKCSNVSSHQATHENKQQSPRFHSIKLLTSIHMQDPRRRHDSAIPFCQFKLPRCNYARSYAPSPLTAGVSAMPVKTENCPPAPAQLSFLPRTAVLSMCVAMLTSSSVPWPVW